VNFTVPFLDEEPSLGVGSGRGSRDFKLGITPGLPSRNSIIQLYREHANWDPAKDIPWGDAFGMFRATVIVQGIAARYASRQASGTSAKLISEQLQPFAEYTFRLVKNLPEHRMANRALL
jgi:aminoglycoside phosphotransferase (APT) family kinase protein